MLIYKTMGKKTKQYLILIIAIIVIIVGAWFLISQSNKPSKLDEFAKCLEKNGAVFYGTFWCPYCQDQKTLFGSSKKYLPYIECSTPDGRSQTFQCRSKNITGYPTWEFSDGSRESDKLSLEKLSEKTGCILP